MIPARPGRYRPRGRYRYRCDNGHEISRVVPERGSPVCQECTTSADELVFMKRVHSDS